MSAFHRVTVVRYGYENKSQKFRDFNDAATYIKEQMSKGADIVIHARPDDHVMITTKGTATVEEVATVVGPYTITAITPFDLDRWAMTDEASEAVEFVHGGVG